MNDIGDHTTRTIFFSLFTRVQVIAESEEEQQEEVNIFSFHILLHLLYIFLQEGLPCFKSSCLHSVL